MDFLILLVIILVVTVLAKTVIIVPQREAFIVERLANTPKLYLLVFIYWCHLSIVWHTSIR